MKSIFTKKIKNKGFTILEMIVVISIFLTLTGILIFNYDLFQKNTDFGLFVQEVAMRVKEVQHNSMSGAMLIDASKKTFPNPEWKPSYGLYFKIRDGKFAKEFDVTKFYDLNSNDKFDSYNLPCGDFGSECLEQFSFKSGLEIVGICSGGVDDTEYYKDGTINCVNNKIENISVTFRRPYPDAHFFRDYNPSNSGTAIQVLESVEILFENKSSQKLQVITINPTGAIFTRQLK